ncbi:hypothetical protein [Falsiroseomonas sp. E2-1-a4]|uniref:hypothetical protein n=1 Tax=Falsiroseomonas sp. E2-1-a4 TaxID=3239299 RepID=UPI003F3B7748
MSDSRCHYIPPKWLDAVAGKTLFYPCAGGDIAEPLQVFAPVISDFWFSDIGYPAGLKMAPALRSFGGFTYTLTGKLINGDPLATIERRDGYRFLPPSRRIETYSRPDGSSFRVIRRRGFGEIALGTEFPDMSVGVFFHRGDSPGEGGSNVRFFENKWRRHEPLRNLFSTLIRKLTEPALIVSDGSLTPPLHPIGQFHRSRMSSAEAFESCRDREWLADGLRWTCVGFVGRRNGPTLVWAVQRA